MDSSTACSGHSATVRLELKIGDRNIELAQIGPDSVYLRSPVSMPPSDAEVVMHIDGRKRVWHVNLPDGLSGDSPIARTKPL